MRTLLLATAVLFSSAALANSEDRTVPQFSAVHISAGMHATVTIGPLKPVHLESDEATLSRIETVVEDGALQVRFKRSSGWSHSGEVKVTIQTPQLHALGASGGSIVDAAFTKADHGSIQASGGSQVTARGIDAAKLSLQASGGSVLRLAGNAAALSLELSGGSQFHGRDFSTRDADVQGSGGSQAELKASGSLRGALSGGSELHVTGGASTAVATSGGSGVYAD